MPTQKRTYYIKGTFINYVDRALRILPLPLRWQVYFIAFCSIVDIWQTFPLLVNVMYERSLMPTEILPCVVVHEYPFIYSYPSIPPLDLDSGAPKTYINISLIPFFVIFSLFSNSFDSRFEISLFVGNCFKVHFFKEHT